VVAALPIIILSCSNPTSSGPTSPGAALPPGGDSAYTPVGSVPVPGGNGELAVTQSGSTFSLAFSEATDAETAQSSLRYALFVSSYPDIGRSEDLWFYQSEVDWFAYPAGGGINFSLSSAGPVYINIGVRDGDQNVSAYTVEYSAPAESAASYTVHDPTYTNDGTAPISVNVEATLSGTADVIYILTNSSATSAPEFTGTSQSVQMTPFLVSSSLPGPLQDVSSPPGIGIRGFPGQHEISEPLVADSSAGDPIGASSTEAEISASEVGAREAFVTASGSVDATAYAVASSGEWNVTVWVDTANTANVTANMVDELTDRFMLAGDSNDIFEWVTGAFGMPWGSHSFSNVISTDRRDIHILLYDIDQDGVPSAGGARTVGYFWPKDNYRVSALSNSNERLMFYMDSALLAAKDGASWQISDFWPAEVVSTLAHEFQHMIHFYQRFVVKGVEADTWVNEMASMAAEDVVSRTVGVMGPRGVDPDEGSAGGSGNGFGRIPGWIAAPGTQLDEWNDNAPLPYYSTSFAFGAAMLRLHGADFLRALLTQGVTGRQAVVNAVNTVATASYDFGDLLSQWAVAMLLSNDTGAVTDYRINTGTWQTTSTNGRSYSIGSINAHNYGAGFPLLTPSAGDFFETIPPSSSIFVQVGTGESETWTDTVELPVGVSLTVVERSN